MATREQYNAQELFAQTLAAALLVMAASAAAPVVAASAVAPAVPAAAPAVPAAAPAVLPAAAESLDDDVRVCSGFKGYSKGGNYGEVVPPPRRLDTATASASGTLALRPLTPYARGPTEDEIAEWMERFEALPATPYPIEVGNVVLWRGFKKGKKEGASTSEEFFRCTGSSRMTGTGRDTYVYHELNGGQNAPHGE